MGYERKRAVVLGASIAGLLAGRVLADFFDDVVLVDKDRLDDQATVRKAVPQGNHVHVILTPTYLTLQRFLPGLIDDLIRHGAPVFDAGQDIRVLLRSKALKNGRTSQPIIGSTRPFFEHHLRRHVMQLSNVEIRSGHRVSRWLMDCDGTRVTGVTAACHGRDKIISADLVVDARGRASTLAAELASAGFEMPATELVGVGLGYTSRLYRVRERAPDWSLLYMNVYEPSTPKGGVIARVENDNWLVTQYGYFGQHAPPDDAGFLRFARSLESPDVERFLTGAEPVSEFCKIGIRECRMMRIDKLDASPDRLLAIGDTVCHLNPVYGQGMTKAANEAAYLWRTLADHLADTDCLDGFADEFRRGLPDVGASWAWRLTKGADLSFAAAIGERRIADLLMVCYMKRLLTRATESLETRSRIFDATMLAKPPHSLLEPRMILRAMGF